MLFTGLLTGSLAKIASDVMMMMSTEFGEVFEPFEHGRGASSTMPQKRNPISSELILACAKLVRQHCALMLDAMVQDFERATGPWHAEWIALPESYIATAGALRQAKLMLAGLSVDTKRMQRNLELTSGLIVTEAVMMGLAPKLGRQVAHDVVYDACRAAAESGRSLLELLCGQCRGQRAPGAAPSSSACSIRAITSAAPRRWWTGRCAEIGRSRRRARR